MLLRRDWRWWRGSNPSKQNVPPREDDVVFSSLELAKVKPLSPQKNEGTRNDMQWMWLGKQRRSSSGLTAGDVPTLSAQGRSEVRPQLKRLPAEEFSCCLAGQSDQDPLLDTSVPSPVSHEPWKQLPLIQDLCKTETAAWTETQLEPMYERSISLQFFAMLNTSSLSSRSREAVH